MNTADIDFDMLLDAVDASKSVEVELQETVDELADKLSARSAMWMFGSDDLDAYKKIRCRLKEVLLSDRLGVDSRTITEKLLAAFKPYQNENEEEFI